MRKNPLAYLTLAAALAAAALPARAAFLPQATAAPGSAPQGINYQGRLEDNGFPVTGSKQMVFRVFDVASGGSPLWTSPAQGVSVTIGLFNAVVPVPITALVGGGSRYLEVEIDGTVMAPRELLNSVPYALIAKSVEGTIDVSTAGLAVMANSAATAPALFISSQTGNVGVGTASPGTAFDVDGAVQFGAGAVKSTFTAAGDLRLAGGLSLGGSITVSSVTVTGNAFSVGASTLVVSAGRVGVLTAAPQAALDVEGAAQFGAGATKSSFTASGGLLVRSNVSVGTGTAGSLPLHVVQAAAGSGLVHLENTGSGHALDVTSRGGLAHLLNGLDSRYKLTPDALSEVGVTNHDYGGLAIGSSGLYSAITSGGSGLNGGVRELYFFTNNDFSTAKMKIDTAGRVGVGTEAPDAPLHVVGVASVTASITVAGVTDASVPRGLVSFFNLAACPTGWSELVGARGRYLVGLPAAGTLAGTAGTALTDLENRAVGQHNHAVTDPGHTHTLASGVVAGAGTSAMQASDNVGNLTSGSSATGLTVDNAGAVAGTNAPYVQLLVCQKD